MSYLFTLKLLSEIGQKQHRACVWVCACVWCSVGEEAGARRGGRFQSDIAGQEFAEGNPLSWGRAGKLRCCGRRARAGWEAGGMDPVGPRPTAGSQREPLLKASGVDDRYVSLVFRGDLSPAVCR